jgi:predicted transcriptional regulator
MTKEEMRVKAEELINHLPENASWDDLMYTIYVRQKIERGISDADNGRTVSTDELRNTFTTHDANNMD